MAGRYKRDSKGRFAGGGGGSRSSRKSSALIAPAPPKGVRFQTGAQRQASLQKMTRSQLENLGRTAVTKGLSRQVFNERARRADALRSSRPKAGSPITGRTPSPRRIRTR